jgi:hypothetical protein
MRTGNCGRWARRVRIDSTRIQNEEVNGNFRGRRSVCEKTTAEEDYLRRDPLLPPPLLLLRKKKKKNGVLRTATSVPGKRFVVYFKEDSAPCKLT